MKFYTGADAFVPTAEKGGFVRVAARRSGSLAELVCARQPVGPDRQVAARRQPSIRAYFPLSRTMSIRYREQHGAADSSKRLSHTVQLNAVELQVLPRNVVVSSRHARGCVNSTGGVGGFS